MGDDIRLVAGAFKRSHRFIWKSKLWRFLGIPVLITVIYLPFLVAGCVGVSSVATSWVMDWLPEMESMGGVIYWVVLVLVLAVVGLVGVFTFRAVVMFFYAPFLDHISERIEETILDRAVQAETDIPAMMLRVGLVLLLTIMGTALVLVLGLAFQLIPIIGAVIGFTVVFPLEMFLGGIGYVDPCLSRQDYSVWGTVKLLLKHKVGMITFTLLGNAIILIPLVGWFIGPTYSVVAGVILAIEWTREEPAGEAAGQLTSAAPVATDNVESGS